MVRISVEPTGLVVQGEGSVRLLDLFDERDDQRLAFSCRSARCGVCRVFVVRGAELLSPPADSERDTLRALGARVDERLACQLTLAANGAGEVRLRIRSKDAPEEES